MQSASSLGVCGSNANVHDPQNTIKSKHPQKHLNRAQFIFGSLGRDKLLPLGLSGTRIGLGVLAWWQSGEVAWRKGWWGPTFSSRCWDQHPWASGVFPSCSNSFRRASFIVWFWSTTLFRGMLTGFSILEDLWAYVGYGRSPCTHKKKAVCRTHTHVGRLTNTRIFHVSSRLDEYIRVSKSHLLTWSLDEPYQFTAVNLDDGSSTPKAG